MRWCSLIRGRYQLGIPVFIYLYSFYVYNIIKCCFSFRIYSNNNIRGVISAGKTISYFSSCIRLKILVF